MTLRDLPVQRSLDRRLLRSAELSKLKDVPPEQEWFADIGSPGTRIRHTESRADGALSARR